MTNKLWTVFSFMKIRFKLLDINVDLMMFMSSSINLKKSLKKSNLCIGSDSYSIA